MAGTKETQRLFFAIEQNSDNMTVKQIPLMPSDYVTNGVFDNKVLGVAGETNCTKQVGSRYFFQSSQLISLWKKCDCLEKEKDLDFSMSDT